MRRTKHSSLDAFHRLQIERMCCRRMFVGYVDLISDQVEYPNRDITLDERGTVLRRQVVRERTVQCD